MVMKHKVILNDRHTVGIVLFGTTKSTYEFPYVSVASSLAAVRRRCSSDFQSCVYVHRESSGVENNVYRFLELESATAARIKKVDSLVSGLVNFDEEIGSLGEDQACPLRVALRVCSQIFMSSVRKRDDWKRIFLFTNDDDPFRGPSASEEKQRTVQIARDAAGMGVEIKLCSLGKSFSSKKFYNQILQLSGDDYNDMSLTEEPASNDLEDLSARVRRKEYTKRRLVRTCLQLCAPPLGAPSDKAALLPTVEMGVQVYNMIHIASIPTSRLLDSRTNRPVQRVTQLMEEATGEFLDDFEISHYVEFGGEHVRFSKTEFDGLKCLGEPGFTLIGFRPLHEALRDDCNVRSPYFLYPDDDAYAGSSRAFIALHSVLLESDLVAVCRFTRASNASPRMVAMVPQEEVVEEGRQVVPPGLNIIFLPYVDEIRGNENGTGLPAAEPHQVEAAEELVDALILSDDFDCRAYQNPALQKHYAALQAIALNESSLEWNEEVDDATRPDIRTIDEDYRDVVDAFKDTYCTHEEPDEAPKKRRSAEDPEAAAKRAKREEDPDTIDIKAAITAGSLKLYTNDVLKKLCKREKLSLTGKKGDLIARLTNAQTGS
jgi:ATP-dependent DNA helicase 2 subunit 1